MITPTDVAWFAGVLEGEGYFALASNNTRGRTQQYPTITVAMCDRDVVQRCADLLGTKVSELRPRAEHHQPTFRCLIRGSGAVEWMLLVYPYMGERRRQKIDEIITAWQQRPMRRKPRMKRAAPTGLALVPVPERLREVPEILPPAVGG